MSTGGASACESCADHTIANAGKSACVPCQSGYNREQGSDVCAICPAGSHCSGGERTTCEAGNFCPIEAAFAIKARAGYYTSDSAGNFVEEGAVEGRLCPAGSYCVEGKIVPCASSAEEIKSAQYCPPGSTAPGHSDRVVFFSTHHIAHFVVFYTLVYKRVYIFFFKS
jgi:hypothetical protein